MTNISSLVNSFNELNEIFEKEQDFHKQIDLCAELYLSKNPDLNQDLVKKSISYGFDMHKKDIRDSGKPYIIHPISVGLTLLTYKEKEYVTLCGPLHDVIEHNMEQKIDISKHILKTFGLKSLLIINAVTILNDNDSNKDKKAMEKLMGYKNFGYEEGIILKAADSITNLYTKQGMKAKKNISKEERINIFEKKAKTNLIPLIKRTNNSNRDLYIQTINHFIRNNY